VDLRTGDELNTLMQRFGDPPLSALDLVSISVFFPKKILEQRRRESLRYVAKSAENVEVY
jgi:hypothetical protein